MPVFRERMVKAMKRELQIATLPVVALRGLVIFPKMMLHFDIGRKKSTAALNAAMEGDREIFLVAQKDLQVDDPKREDLYACGVVASVRQVLRLPGTDNIRVVVEGRYRAGLVELTQDAPFLCGIVQEKRSIRARAADDLYQTALVRHIKDLFGDYAEVAPKVAPDMMLAILANDDPGDLADFIAGNIMLDFTEKQRILDELSPIKRLEALSVILTRETELLSVEEEIQQHVQEQMDKNQREYFLREQLKVISEELGDADNPQDEAESYRDKILAAAMPQETEEQLLETCGRLFKMSPGSQEATVLRNYLDTVLALPWNQLTKDHLDLDAARRQLDRDHYGLDKVKERMIEMLAVRKLSPDIKGQIICLVGPPGVGKTSIARSVAKAMGRKYARISLGGVHDEAEIRGHRKTYIGAMPGRIMDAMKQAGSSNPLILLDEIDKVGADYRGDPASALLEALDGEQNFAFRDHYIEVPFDLSKVLFITTANDAGTIPAPLLDRMELIELASYTHEEKFHIAKDHLVPKQAKRHGLSGRTLRIRDDAIHALIDGYTREAGVRKLERAVASLCRRAAVQIADGEKKRVTVTAGELGSFLGPQKFKPETIRPRDEVGVVTGLAWTSVGGETMPVEVAVMDGTGKLELTGSLGDVMKESAHAAVSFIRSHADALHVDKNFYKEKDIHIHVPEGAVPKDGPSAGVTLATALVSALTEIPVRRDLAMTGEITLRGRVLPIGGLKEKSMAAYRTGVKTVVIPADNVPDLAEIDPAVRAGVEFVPASELSTVFHTALLPQNSQQDAAPEEAEASVDHVPHIKPRQQPAVAQ